MSDTLYFFDLDGTLTSKELLPIIAKEVGLESEMADLTMKTMAGIIPFDQSFRHRVSMLRGVSKRRISEIICEISVHEQIIDWIKSNNDRCFILTGNLDCWVGDWLRKYKMKGFTSVSGENADGVFVERVLYKQDVIEQYAGKRTVMVGDGANDAQAIAVASVGIANSIVHTVPQVVLEVADYLFFDEGPLCKALSRLS